MKVCIVGGGSAGWMTATTFIKCITDDITLIESPNIPTSGVGESTLGSIQNWIDLIGIRADELSFIKETNGTLKHSIKFTNFLEKDSGSFHYPFGKIDCDAESWWNLYMHDTLNMSFNDYALDVSHVALLAEKGKINMGDTHAYHFDAIKFGQYLKKEYCKEVNHITANVINYEKQNENIKNIKLDNGNTIEADLFIDCTGFASKLIGEFLNEPFISYNNKLPNDSAWATHIPHVNKKKMRPYTECTAINNGWVWNIPLWDKVGTGYVYSSKHISHEDAKQEFITHLGTDECEFKHIPMRIGRYKRTWVGNVIAIGLSAGFLEPLEGNGLYTVHSNLINLYKTLRRGKPSKILKDYYNDSTALEFDEFADFIIIHYAFTQREDTPYWKDIFNKTYDISNPDMDGLLSYCRDLYTLNYFRKPNRGFPYIASGMGICPLQSITHDYKECLKIKELNKKWEEEIKNLPPMYDYLKEYIYN